MTFFQNPQVFHASLCPLGHVGYMKANAGIVLPLIVAALHNVDVEYRYEEKAGKTVIRGRGELVASESGISVENLVKRTKVDLSWQDPLKFYSEICRVRDGFEPAKGQMGRVEAQDALNHILAGAMDEKIKSLYLNLDLLATSPLGDVQLGSRKIRESYPQINICLTKEPKECEKHCFRQFKDVAVEGAIVGVLSDQIRQILSTVHRIKQSIE